MSVSLGFICHSDAGGISVCCSRLLGFFLRQNDKGGASIGRF